MEQWRPGKMHSASTHGLYVRQEARYRIAGATWRARWPASCKEVRMANPTHDDSCAGSRNFHAHVLLVEDDPSLGTATSEVLKHLGHDVAWEVSANDAYAALSQPHRFDVVVLDLGLGDSDGVTLISALRARDHALPPILVFSAWPTDAMRRAVGAIGAVMGLQKPCSMSELDAALRRTRRVAAV